jgi:urea transport system permease protein
MKTMLFAELAALIFPNFARAQANPVQDVLLSQRSLIEESSRRTIGPAIDAIANSDLPQMQAVLEAWQAKNMWQRGEDGLFFAASRNDDKSYQLVGFATGAMVGTRTKDTLVQIKPNSGIRAMIATAIVRFQLSDPDKVRRCEALDSISRDPEAASLSPLRASIATETDPALLACKTRLERLMTLASNCDTAARVATINEMAGDLSVDFRAH